MRLLLPTLFLLTACTATDLVEVSDFSAPLKETRATHQKIYLRMSKAQSQKESFFAELSQMENPLANKAIDDFSITFEKLKKTWNHFVEEQSELTSLYSRFASELDGKRELRRDSQNFVELKNVMVKAGLLAERLNETEERHRRLIRDFDFLVYQQGLVWKNVGELRFSVRSLEKFMKIRIRKATANIQRVRAQKRRIASLETRRSVADIEGLKKIVRRMNIEQEKFSSEVQPFYQEVGRRKKILVAPHMATFDISPRMNLYRQRFLELSTKFDKLSEH